MSLILVQIILYINQENTNYIWGFDLSLIIKDYVERLPGLMKL